MVVLQMDLIFGQANEEIEVRPAAPSYITILGFFFFYLRRNPEGNI